MSAPGWYQEPQASDREDSPGWMVRHKRRTAVVAVVLLAWWLTQVDEGPPQVEEAAAPTKPSVVAPADDESSATSHPTKHERQRPASTQRSRDAPVADPQRTSGAAGERAAPRTDPRGSPKPRRTYLVTRIIDGDTLELGNGETVRLVGIDTPEVGECGYDKAGAALGRLTLSKRVSLSDSDEDRDRYGRLLRYIDVGEVDAGLRLIQRGLAIARYDSRDGYGYHPRERRYIAADRATKPVGCPKPAPLVTAPDLRGNGKRCAPGYSPCVPPAPPDLNCADVNGPLRVTGSDPHGLDADGDGIACES